MKRAIIIASVAAAAIIVTFSLPALAKCSGKPYAAQPMCAPYP